MRKGFLKAMDSAKNDGPYHKKKQLKLIQPPNGKAENWKLMNGFAGLQSMCAYRKLRKWAIEYEEPVAEAFPLSMKRLSLKVSSC